MQKPLEKLSIAEVIVLLSSTILGAGILSMPLTVTESIHTPDGWLVILIHGAIFLIIGLLVAQFAAKNPKKTIFDLNREVAGKVIGSLLNGYMTIYFLGGVGYEARTMGDVTTFFLLSETPLIIVVSLFVLVGIFYLKGTIFSITKLFTYLFPLTIITFFILMAFSSKIFKIQNILPILGEGASPLFFSLHKTFSFFAGFEVILFLVPWMEKSSDAKKATITGIGIATIFYCVTLIFVTGGMSMAEIELARWPTISLIQSFEIEGIFIQRFDVFLLIIWTLQIFTTQLIFLYGAFLGCKSLFNKHNNKWLFLFLFVGSVGIAMYPSDANKFSSFGGVFGYGFFGILFIPLILFSLQILQNKLGRKAP